MASQDSDQPNHFVLRGYDGTEITYDTTSISGQPQLSYSGPLGQHNFSDGDIGVAQTELGAEVTVTLESIPDLRTVTLTLLIPPFRLSNGPEQFVTLAIVTTRHTTIAGPPEGQGYSYEAISLSGEASRVQF